MTPERAPPGTGTPEKRTPLQAGPVMVCAKDTWMQAGLAAAVQDVTPDWLIREEDLPALLRGHLLPVPGGQAHWQGLSALLFWLPDLQQGQAEAVRHLASLLLLCRESATVLLLTRETPGWLYRTLKNLAPQARGVLSRVQCLPDRLSPHELQQALRGCVPDEAVLLRDAGHEACLPGLSSAELMVLGATLQGTDIHDQAAQFGYPVRVLHRLRWQAMQKLGELRVKNLRHSRRARW